MAVLAGCTGSAPARVPDAARLTTGPLPAADPGEFSEFCIPSASDAFTLGTTVVQVPVGVQVRVTAFHLVAAKNLELTYEGIGTSGGPVGAMGQFPPPIGAANPFSSVVALPAVVPIPLMLPVYGGRVVPGQGFGSAEGVTIDYEVAGRAYSLVDRTKIRVRARSRGC